MPEAKIIEGDTVILISPAQLKFANLKIARANFCNVQELSYKSVITNLKTENETLALLNKEVRLNNSILKYNLGAYKRYTDETKTETAYLFKQERKDRRKATVTAGIIGIIIGLVGSIFI